MSLVNNNSNEINSYIALCKPGLAEYCNKELEEFQQQIEITNILKDTESVVFSLKNKDLLEGFQKISISYSLSKLIWQGEDPELVNSLDVETVKKLILDIVDFSNTEKKESYNFRVLCEGISGNENRIQYCSIVQKALTILFGKQGIKLVVDYKNPEFVFSLSLEDATKTKKFSLGLKLHQKELDKREWRVYTHKASFRGDFASTICQLAEIKKGDSTLFLFCRDGAIAIESALQKNNFPIREVSKSLRNYVTSESVMTKEKINQDTQKIICLDDAGSNIRAAVNNAKMAGVNHKLKFELVQLDEVDFTLDEQSIDTAIVHITGKDEKRINEIFSQLNKILKSGAKVLFITRSGFEIEGDSTFSLKWYKQILRGSGFIPLSLLIKN